MVKNISQKGNYFTVKLRFHEEEYASLQKLAAKKHISVEKYILQEVKKILKFNEIKVSISYI